MAATARKTGSEALIMQEAIGHQCWTLSHLMDASSVAVDSVGGVRTAGSAQSKAEQSSSSYLEMVAYALQAERPAACITDRPFTPPTISTSKPGTRSQAPSAPIFVLDVDTAALGLRPSPPGRPMTNVRADLQIAIRGWDGTE